ncbi:MAG TPA: DMT family transporter [Methylomirabilota bacterium]
MTALALGLVVLAACSHATWNLLTKQSRHHLAFLWWTGLVGTVLYLPAVLWSGAGGPWPATTWAGIALAAVVRAAYLAALGSAYARGDLSQVYPLARGVAPILVPPAAMLLLGERPTGIGLVGVLTVGLGVYVLHLPAFRRTVWLAPFRALRAGPARWAILTGGLTTVYSLLDAWNVRRGVPPLFYAWATIPVAALLLAPGAWRAPAACRAEWRAASARIAAVAVLMTGGYYLILLAVRIAPVSYVAPARELSIVFGTLLGITVLGEWHPAPRLAGAALILAGVLVLGAAA